MTKLNSSEVYAMTTLMQSKGGSFVAALGQALRYADPANRQRILDAFPELVERYGPQSALVKSTQLTEA
jgi:hypothetical protein